MVAEKLPAKNRWRPWRLWPDSRLRRERGPRIDRHPMGRGLCLVSQIVGGHTDNDIRRCSGPIGSKRHQKRLSSVILACFGPFSQRDAARLLPRFRQHINWLLLLFFVTTRVARGCPGVELRASKVSKMQNIVKFGFLTVVEATRKAARVQSSF